MNDLITRKDALHKGLVKYFTGRPCKHGHLCERYVDSGVCKECLYRTAYAYHKTHLKEKAKATKKWRQVNPDYYSNRYATSSTKSKAFTKRWKVKNPDKVALLVDRRKRILKQATPSWFEQDRVHQLYQKRDEWSKLLGVDLTVDHVVPLQGKTVCGLHCWLNLQLIERAENGRKHNKSTD